LRALVLEDHDLVRRCLQQYVLGRLNRVGIAHLAGCLDSARAELFEHAPESGLGFPLGLIDVSQRVPEGASLDRGNYHPQVDLADSIRGAIRVDLAQRLRTDRVDGVYRQQSTCHRSTTRSGSGLMPVRLPLSERAKRNGCHWPAPPRLLLVRMSGPERRPRGRLRRSDCSGPGIGRRRRGSGFSYLDPEGGRVRDEDTLERIRAMAIPPAWREVWICSDPYGHIQATGLDEAGRKQYLYHERWHLRAAQRKFESMREFAARLPGLRRAVKKDLAREGLPRERALACAVRLLDLGFFRIGGEEYAETNESYGMATVLREHVSSEDEEVVFDFPAKSGQRRVQSIRDPEVKAAIEAMRRRRSGPDDLLVFRDGGVWRDVRSEEVNDYLQARQLRRRYAAAPTSTRACSTAFATARRSSCRASPPKARSLPAGRACSSPGCSS
jgi:DNA topoisomerase IB